MKIAACSAAVVALTMTVPAASWAATYDLTGDWAYAHSDKTVTGVCPLGSLNAGVLRIEQTGDTATLELLTGGDCSPASMCLFDCTIADDVTTCSNSDVVDTEGGVATNTVTLTASSADEAEGPAVSTYSQGQVACQWDYTVSMTRQGGGSGGGAGTGGGTSTGGGAATGGGTTNPPGDTSTDDGGDSGCAVAPSGRRSGGWLWLVGLVPWLGWGRRRALTW